MTPSRRRPRPRRRRRLRPRRARPRSSARPGPPTGSRLYEVRVTAPRRAAGAHVGRLPRAARARAGDPRRADTVIVPGIHAPVAPPTRGTLDRRPRPPRWRRIRPRRPAGVDLHRRVRAGRGRAARRPPGHHPLGLRRPVPASCSRRSTWTRTCCSSTTATCSPRPAWPPGSTCACTWSAATTAARWPTGRPGAAWCRRGATAARRSSSSASCRPRPDASTGPAREWALDRLDEPLDLAALAAQARMSVRTFTRRFREETGLSPGAWLTGQRVELRPAAAGDHRPAGGRGGPAGRLRHRRLAAPAPARRGRRVAAGLPPHLPPRPPADTPRRSLKCRRRVTGPRTPAQSMFTRARARTAGRVASPLNARSTGAERRCERLVRPARIDSARVGVGRADLGVEVEVHEHLGDALRLEVREVGPDLLQRAGQRLALTAGADPHRAAA